MTKTAVGAGTPDPICGACTNCGEVIRGLVYRSRADGKPRCGRCHVFAAEKAKREAKP